MPDSSAGCLNPQHILGRAVSPEGVSEFAPILASQRILVTGAAGSIGSSLSLQLLSVVPAALFLLDNHENSLANLRKSLGVGNASYILADVRDQNCMERIMRSSRPDVVFHLAAYKHVDMGEMFPDHYVSNNVLATWRLARLAITGGVARFVYPSSDKAVHPCSVYGATKRAVELGLSSLNSSLSTSRFLLARLVNVLGARGGVFETLITQASNGQSLTLTHPEMTRFWITEGEAIRLLAWAATTSEAGDCFELNCGEAVSLQAVARALWERYCPSGQEFSVNYIGPRPGERLEEVLWSTTETCEPCETSGIVRIQGDRSSLWSSSDIDTEFALWGRLIDEGNLDELSRRLQQLTGAYFATPPRNG